jgi:hypothetical protein
VCGIGDVIVIDAPSERRETLAYDRVLVDLDDVLVSKDLERLFRSVAEVGTDEQGGLEERPSGEVALCFVEGQISWRGALSGIADFQQV